MVRSDADEEIIDMNKKLIIFILHKGTLYSWQRPQTSVSKQLTTQSRQIIIRDPESFIVKTQETN